MFNAYVQYQGKLFKLFCENNLNYSEDEHYTPACFVDTKALARISDPLSMYWWVMNVQKVLKILCPDPMNSGKLRAKCKRSTK